MFDALRAVDGAPAAFVARWHCGPARFAPWGTGTSDEVAEDGTLLPPGNDSLGDDLWSAGFAAGQAALEAALEHEANAMDALLRALDRLAPLPRAALAERLEKEVRALLLTLVGTASVDEELLVERCLALAELAAADGDSALHAHPEDAALLAAARPELAIVADERLPRGELRLTDGAGEAATGPRTMLADWEARSGDTPC